MAALYIYWPILKHLDDMRGIMPGAGQMIVVAARPGVGKSTLGLDFVRSAAIRHQIELVERELATDLARLTDPSRWSTEDLRVLSNLIVTLMVGATETIVNARPEARPAILETARTQLRMMLVGAVGWQSR